MCDVTAAVVAGTAVAGAASAASSKGKTQTATQTSTSTPWGPQADQLQKSYNHSDDLYAAQTTLPAWDMTHQNTALQNDTQREGLGMAAGYARQTGGQLADQTAQTAGVLQSGVGQYVGNAGTLAATGAGPANSTATGVLTQAARGQPMGSSGVAGQTGLAGQTGALLTAQGLAVAGQADNTGSVLGSAGAFYNSDQVKAAQAAARDDITNTLTTDTLRSLNSRAMAGGNVNSARAGAAESVARGEAARAIASSDAAISSDAWGTAVNAALTNSGQQNALALGANAQAGSVAGALSTTGEAARQFDTSTQIGAAQSLGALDTSNRQLDANTRLSANQQLGQAAAIGVDAATAAGGQVDANAARIGALGDAQQANEQAQIDENRSDYYSIIDRDKQALADYYAVAGNENWGKSSTDTTTAPLPQVDMLQGALAGASLGKGVLTSGMLGKTAASDTSPNLSRMLNSVFGSSGGTR